MVYGSDRSDHDSGHKSLKESRPGSPKIRSRPSHLPVHPSRGHFQTQLNCVESWEGAWRSQAMQGIPESADLKIAYINDRSQSSG